MDKCASSKSLKDQNQNNLTDILNPSFSYRDASLLIRTIIDNNREEINKFYSENKKFSLKTEADILLDILKNKEMHFRSNLIEPAMFLSKIMNSFNEKHQDFIRATLFSGVGGMIEAQRAGIEFIISEFTKEKFKSYKKLKISEIYKDDAVSEKEVETVLFALESSSQLIPDKYKKKLGDITVLIRDKDSELSSSSTIDTGNLVITLIVRQNNIIQTAEAFHELLHLIEKSNPLLMKKSNEFLKSRLISKNKESLDSLSKNYNIKYSPLAKEVHVYPGRFVDSYIGRAYGDLNLKKNIPTEVLSVGGEYLFLDPIGLLVKDNYHFSFIADLLLGRL